MRLMIRFNRILLCAGMILAMLPFVGYGVAMAQQDTASFQEETVAGIPRVMLTVDPDALQSVLDSRDHTYRSNCRRATPENSAKLIPSALGSNSR